jgi:AcrR family transcriptional regulator
MSDTKQLILKAAKELTQEFGAEHLTIDAVAKRAGLSKGGVMYHYKTKKDLLVDMVNSYAQHLEHKLESGKEKNRQSLDPLVPGFISWFETFKKNDEGSRVWGASLFAVHSHDPQLLEPVHDWYKKLFEEIRKSPYGFEKAASTILTLEGLFYLNLFDMDYLTEEEHAKLLKYLKEKLPQ